MVCPKGTRLQTRMRTGTGEEAEAMAGRAEEAGAVAPPWKAETRRAAEGAAAAAANRRREEEEEEGIGPATAVDKGRELRRFRAAAAAIGREEDAAAVAAERILT